MYKRCRLPCCGALITLSICLLSLAVNSEFHSMELERPGRCLVALPDGAHPVLDILCRRLSTHPRCTALVVYSLYVTCMQHLCAQLATMQCNQVRWSCLTSKGEFNSVSYSALSKATGDLTTSWIAGVSHTSRHNSCHSQARHCQGPEAALPGAASPPHALGNSCSEPVATTSDYLMDSHRTSVDAAQQMSLHASGRSLCQGSTVSR